MRVNLAAQVLNSFVAAVEESLGPPDAAGTSNFCMMVDGFFDFLNVRSTTEDLKKRKSFLAPYTLPDARFKWLNDFLHYLKTWKESRETRPGNFNKNARSRMHISWQTYEGFQITCHSAIEATKFLLQEGMDFVLTERFLSRPC